MTSDNLFSPFPGTRPYSETETTNFYGRERETQDVLDILKRYKLVTICGENGSGKSSLIQAGIIPKLRKGFLGQTGKEWVICNFRPGVSPIENLSYALSDSGAMYLKGKSKTTDHQNYKSKIEEKIGRPGTLGPSGNSFYSPWPQGWVLRPGSTGRNLLHCMLRSFDL